VGAPVETERSEEIENLVETETAEQKGIPAETVTSGMGKESEGERTEVKAEGETGVSTLQPGETAPGSPCKA